MPTQRAAATTKERRRSGEGQLDGKDDGGAESARMIFFAGANFETSQQKLRSFFASAGRVEKIVLFRLEDARSTGMGHVVYTTREGALNALATLNDRELEGARVTLRAPGVAERGAADRKPGAGAGDREREQVNDTVCAKPKLVPQKVIPSEIIRPAPGLELCCGSQEPHNMLGIDPKEEEEDGGQLRRLSRTRASTSTRASSSSILAALNGRGGRSEARRGRQRASEAERGRMPRPWKVAMARLDAARRLSAQDSRGAGEGFVWRGGWGCNDWGVQGNQSYSVWHGGKGYPEWDDWWNVGCSKGEGKYGIWPGGKYPWGRGYYSDYVDGANIHFDGCGKGRGYGEFCVGLV